MIQTSRSFVFPLIVSLFTLVFLDGFLGNSVVQAEDHSPAKAVSNLQVAAGLEATLSASEPMIVSLTNIDVDERGRVWACEVVNYRRNQGKRPEGDRILILEDTTGDGVMDQSNVFYQGNDIDSAIGLCVLGNKVIVSAAPNVLVFTDENNDGKSDKKEVLFTGISGQQHDHSVHSFVFGPDGKLYFNFGNVGKQLMTPDGKPVIDLAGNVVSDQGKPYRQGMVFRCNLDGSEVETLAHNFRNNYEVTVDSFGTMWQSDNDDDGNRGVRINYVMEYGNYGYTDELTGASWYSYRTGRHIETPKRHWHLNDPGVVPNLLQTGAGSPTGITIYEGDLLPEVFRNQLIHCDAGPSVVRAYPVEKDGAGYKARIVDVLNGAERDQWFRPVDVSVAPDGSLFVSDWFDPGVGGHAQADTERGRLFRVAPPSNTYQIPKFDFSTIPGAIEALKSPNSAVRYLAWTALHKRGTGAEPALKAMFKESPNPRHRARALWLLGKIPGRGDVYVQRAIYDDDSDIRIVGVRLARQLKLDILKVVKQLVSDKSPQVRRECAIALRHSKDKSPGLWAKLAAQHDGRDRWYLEALGIGSDLDADFSLFVWAFDDPSDDSQRSGQNVLKDPAYRDIVWRSRSKMVFRVLTSILASDSTPSENILRYIRAFDFHSDGTEKQKALESLLVLAEEGPHRARRDAILAETITRLDKFKLGAHPLVKASVLRHLKTTPASHLFFNLIEQFSIHEASDDLAKIAMTHASHYSRASATKLLLEFGNKDRLEQILKGDDNHAAAVLVESLGNVSNGKSQVLLESIVSSEDDYSRPIRNAAVQAVGRTTSGQTFLLDLVARKTLSDNLQFSTANVLFASRDSAIREEAARHLKLPESKDSAPLPPLSELVRRRGEVDLGKKIFATSGTCIKCHKIGDDAMDATAVEVGPSLSEIGSKLSREAMFTAILDPNAGVSHNYETTSVVLANGKQESGILLSKTDEVVTLKNSEGMIRSFETNDIDEIERLPTSLMPSDLQKAMTEEDLVNLVEFLTTRKAAKK